MADTNFAIVSWSHEGKQITDRSRIRSLCMKGKNKREGSRRSLRDAKRQAKKQTPDSKPTTAKPHENAARGALVLHMPITPPLDPDIALLASRVNKTACYLLHEVLLFDELVNGKDIYTVEVCVTFDVKRLEHLETSLVDEVFMHTILLTNSAVRDHSQRQQPTEATRFHLSKTLALLNERLTDKDSYLMDSTIYTVLSLAVMAAIFGDLAATRAHLIGLQRVIDLRGGYQYLQQQPKLQFKVDTADLVWCLAFGGTPLFLSDDISWVPLYRPLAPIEDDYRQQHIPDDLLDPRLLFAFRDLQYLTFLINESYENNTRIHASLFQPMYSSVQARLLKLKDCAQDTLSECFCLGALAFLSTTFRIPGRRLEYPYLARRLRKACQKLDTTKPELRILTFWLLMVCGVSVFEFNELWLHVTWAAVKRLAATWNDAREILKSIIWVPPLQDTMGKQLFASLVARQQ